jgi:hypothetical protein
MEIGLQPIHVKEPEQKGNLFGTGWVRHTWEHALAEKGKEEINQLIRTEKPNCPALAAPRVVLGNREEEILRELQAGAYDLFMEGALASFNVNDFRNLVRSKLYQNVPCPIVVVKNLVPLEKTSLLLYEGMDAHRLIKEYVHVFKEAKLALDLLYYTPGTSDTIHITEADLSEPTISSAKQLLEDAQLPPHSTQRIAGTPQQVGEYLADYALVGAAIIDEAGKKNPILTVLARTPSPVFIC